MLPQPAPKPSPAHVLVVEDDVLTRAVLAEEMRFVGLNVIEANCADDALVYIRAGGQVDVVFSDVQMPGVLDGQQLAKVMATDYPAIPIILTSGDTDLGTRMQGRPFVVKPYRISRVIALVFTSLNIIPPEGYS